MKESLQKLEAFITTLSITTEQRAELLLHMQDLLKIDQRKEFMLRRTLKDKHITINLLNQTIEDLKGQKQALSEHQQQIEAINKTLTAQTVLLEKQSATLEENLHQLKIAYRELELFSYIASHDLRSPLRTIASYAQLLEQRYRAQLDTEGQEFLQYVLTGTDQMNHVLEDLLEYARAGDRTRQLLPTDVNKVMELICYNLKKEITESGAVLQTETLPTLNVLRSSLYQILQNLVANAIKFRSAQPPQIRICCIRTATHWHFTVTDNGIGIKEAEAAKIFEPFQRLNQKETSGTGIGLAICKKLVDLHRGKIWYDSKPGEGTTFHFTILAN